MSPTKRRGFWLNEPPIPERISLISRRTWNGGNGETCRVVIEGGFVSAWTAEGRTVVLSDRAAVTGIARSGTAWLVGTKGGVWDVVPGGCACGSPLRSWEPKGAEVG